jgi:hypothetical protein
MAINYDAPASLHKWETREGKRAGDARMLGAGQVRGGTLAGCIKRFLATPQSLQHLYDIMVGEESGTDDL